jgi:O-antigen ligase
VWKVIVVPLPGASLTIGRLLVVSTTLTAVVELLKAPRPLARPDRLSVAVGAATAGLLGWATLSAAAWGCDCSSEIAGLAEMAAVAGLALALAVLEPRLRAPLIVAVLGGAALTAALAVAGVEGLTEGARTQATEQGRLAGPHGNPNYLAYSVALGVPVALVALRLYDGRRRWAVALTLLGMGLAIVLTYSRGGILAALAGSLAVGVLSATGTRHRLRVLGGFVAVAVVAGALYPAFVESRREANTIDPDPRLKSVDVSGWDARSRGMIPAGPAEMANAPGGVLRVDAEPQEGVSFGWGAAERGVRYELSLSARSDGPARIGIGLADHRSGNGPSVAIRTVTETWRTFRISWTPVRRSPHGRLYVFRSGGGARRFELRQVTVSAPNLPAGPIAVPTALRGTAYERERARRIREKVRRDASSRRAGVELAARAFGSAPLHGIGWGDFPGYADQRAGFGRLATHNEYLRFLAELGLIGIGLLATVSGLLLAAVTRMARDALGVAVVGLLAAGAVGLLFLNGLVAVHVSIGLALAGAVCVARAARPVKSPEGEGAGAWWPPKRLPPRGVF